MSVAIKTMGTEQVRQKVLILDGDLISQSSIKGLLETDFDLFCEPMGTCAVLAAESVRPQIVLLDLNTINEGLDVLKEMKSHPHLGSVPVICLGLQDHELRNQALKLGAAGFLAKPLNTDQMATDIRALVKNRNAEVSSLDRKNKMFIGSSWNETSYRLKEELSSSLNRSEKVLVIAFNEGLRSFSMEPFQLELESGNLIILQVQSKSQPSLNDVQSIPRLMKKIEEFTGEPTTARSLILVNPESIIGQKADDETIAGTILLAETMSKSFRSVRYFSTSSDLSGQGKNLNSMARLLVGNLH